MLDLKLIRDDPERVRAALARRGEQAAAGMDAVLDLDARRRGLIPTLEELRASRNAAAEAIAQAKRSGQDASDVIATQREVGAREKQLSGELAEIEQQLQAALAPLPNLPDPSAAPGPEDELVKTVGEPRIGSYPADTDAGPRGRERAVGVRDHLELAGAMIDMDAAAKLSGSRFAYLKGDLVLVELALVRFALEKLRGYGFEPVIPPVLVRERALYGTGFLPDTEQQIYRLADDDLFLLGTSEVALASLHDEEILPAERLPLRYAGFSPCFRPAPPARTHAGSSGYTSSTRWRCSASSSRSTRARSTRGSWRSRRRSSPSWICPIASSTSPSPTLVTRLQRSTTARHGCRARVATES